jgi:hypothetical protein
MQTLLRKRFTDAIRNFMRDPEVSGIFSPKVRARAFLEREPEIARLFLIEEKGFCCSVEEPPKSKENAELKPRGRLKSAPHLALVFIHLDGPELLDQTPLDSFKS